MVTKTLRSLENELGKIIFDLTDSLGEIVIIIVNLIIIIIQLQILTLSPMEFMLV